MKYLSSIQLPESTSTLALSSVNASNLGLKFYSSDLMIFIAGGQDTVKIGTGYFATNAPLNFGLQSNPPQINYSGNNLFIKAGTLSTTGYISVQTGNLLVGTTTDAGYKLDVNGNTRSTQFVVVDGSTIISRDGTYLQIHGTSGVKITAWDGGYKDALVVLPTSGNVGIGVGSASHKLNVDGGVAAEYFQLDTTATPTPVPGMMFWDQDSQTPDVQLDSALVAKMFQDEFWYVKNQTGSTIPKGTVVMAVGTLGASARILVAPMIADGSISTKYILGIAAEDILDGGDGSVTRAGKIKNLNTTAFVDGDVLYANPAVAGGLTNVLPQAPNLKLAVAFVVYAATNGVLAVKVELGSDLYENHRVQVTSPTDGQLLRYDNADQRWENWTPNFLTTVPTLDQVTTAGNTTTNDISIGSLAVDTNLIYTDAVNNSVGIGTSSPTEKLDVEGNVRIGVGFQLRFNNANVGAYRDSNDLRLAGYTGIQFMSSATSMTAQTERMRIVGSTGNVLINTTTDAGYKLDVNGQVRVQDKLRVGTVNSGNGVVHMSSSATINPSDTTIVWAQNVSVGMCAFIEYYILNSNSLTDQRAGTIMVTWNQSGTPTIAHTETTTPDIGSTIAVNFTSSLVGSDARINAVNSSADSYTIVMSYKYF